MNVHVLHKAYINMWPNQVRIDDGYSAAGNFMLPTLSHIHRIIEAGIDYKTDHWRNIFTWSMFQACHIHAQNLLKQGITEMALAEVPLKIIDQCIVNNLSGEDWAKEKALYAAT